MEFSYIGNQSKKDVRLAGSFANGAFVSANSAASFANGAYLKANASYVAQNTTATFANGAFVTANSSASFANGAFDRANSGYDVANTGSSFANGAFVTANTGASFANGSFVTANSAAIFANGAFAHANAAYAAANTGSSDSWARQQANAAYAQANTIGSSTPITIYSDVFTANGNTATFNLSTTPTSENYIIAVVDGITQLRSTYAVTGNVVVFDSTFDNGSNVEITTITGGGALDPYAANTANLAYAQANAAFAQANTGSTDTWVRTQANNAFDAANSGAIFANGSFVVANSASIFANASFDRANAAYAQANNSTDTWVRTQANTAYDTANSAQTFANGAFITANSSATFANAAFITANSAASFANGAFSAANLKFNTSGGTISGDVSITGNLSVLGNAFSTSATQIVANDTLFIMGTGNYSGDVLDIGFSSHYNDGTNAHTGIIRDAGTKEWHVFEGYTPEVGANNSIDINHASFKIATLQANLKSTTITIKGIDLLPYVNNAYATANSGASFANSAFITANASYESQNTTASFANGAFITANAAFNAANNATDPWVRNQANNSYNTANGAFVTANSAASFANGAFAHANAAYTQANTGSSDSWARAQANAAFNVANTANSAIANSGILTGYVDAFTANGVSNNYTLSTTPSNKNITFVAVQGVLQPKASYNISGTSLTFDSTPPNTAYIEVTTLVGSGGGSGGSSITSSITWYIANANTTMVASSGYFVDTSTGPKTMTLPAAAILGDTIRFNDLAGTFSANNLTVARNSHNIQGIASDLLVDIDQSSFGLVYSNTTYGWKVLEL